MKKLRILIINGPNLDMLGVRDNNIYGSVDYKGLLEMIKEHADKRGIKVDFFQSYFEGEIARMIAHMNKKAPYSAFGLANVRDMQFVDSIMCDAIVLNAGAYSHYSYAIRDAIELNDTPIAEVHISDIEKREEFRHNDVLKDVVDVYIKGEGLNGYLMAIDSLIGILSKDKING
ncbi:MAG: type II 3-dehydroquinate dehydratase [Clostridia bacterium]